MKCIRIHEFGDESVLKIEEVDIPKIKDDEILVRVRACGVNPIDWKIRKGDFKDFKLPKILGYDFSGIVIERGTQVTHLKIGDEVIGSTALKDAGAYAEYVAIKAEFVARKPKHIGFLEAASIPFAGTAAYQCIYEISNIKEGDRVLIHGAAGGVGSHAVQMAKSKGAYIIGTVSKLDLGFASYIGCDKVLNFEEPNYLSKLESPVDFVLDPFGGETLNHSYDIVSRGGLIVSLAEFPDMQKCIPREITGYMNIYKPSKTAITSLANLIKEAKLRPLVTRILPFEEIVEAHRYSQAGKAHGKIVLRL